MEHPIDRRSFLRIAGTSLSIGALYSVFPALARAEEAGPIMRTLAQLNGEAPAPFSFMQLSDRHVGFNGPPDPLGTKAFENAVATINRLKNRPELVIVTGDLTHDADSAEEHARRFRLFNEIAGKTAGAQSRLCRAKTTPRSTAAIFFASSWARRTTPSTVAAFISSPSTMSQAGGRRSAPNSLPG